MKTPAPALVLVLLMTVCFTLSTWLQPRAVAWNPARAQSDSLLALTFGDARRMFARHFNVKANVYFHRGYYPSIFDQGRTNEIRVASEPEQAGGHSGDHDDEFGFIGPPHDWIEAFGRHFFNVKHSELAGAEAREVLPWLRIAAELDPHDLDNYRDIVFLLRQMGRLPEAEQLLREGLRKNPGNPQLLFDLGRIFSESRRDPARARNVWEAALTRLTSTPGELSDDDKFLLGRILGELALLEEQAGNYDRAISLLERLKAVSPNPAEVQKRIEEAKLKQAP